jgi:hypothetical protein
LETQLLLSVNLGYGEEGDVAGAAKTIAELQRMVAAIRRKLSAVV